MDQQHDRRPTLQAKGAYVRVHKPTNYDKYKGMMDYGKGNEFKFLHQTNFDLDRVLQSISPK